MGGASGARTPYFRHLFANCVSPILKIIAHILLAQMPESKKDSLFEESFICE